MATRSTLLPLLFGALSVGLAGCNDPFGNGDIGQHVPMPLPDAAFPVDYPSTNIGVTVGSVIDNYGFTGLPNPMVSSTATQIIHLSDFYNPHADDPTYMPSDPSTDDRLYPEGSPYIAAAGRAKPRVLFIDVSSVWCGPCNQEAKNVLPGRYAKYKGCGGQFLFQLAEGPAEGTPATDMNLVAWTSAYKVNYPSTIDAGHQLAHLYGAPNYPDEIIIDTRTMTIESIVAAVPDDAFWSTFESELVPGCLASQ